MERELIGFLPVSCRFGAVVGWDMRGWKYENDPMDRGLAERFVSGPRVEIKLRVERKLMVWRWKTEVVVA